MRSFWRTLSQPVYIPLVDKAEDIYRTFSRPARGLFLFLAAVLVVSAVGLAYLLNSSLLVAVPGYGGSLSEGIVGAPRFVNPVLANSDADNDLSILIYSGLLRATPEGSYVPDLAQSYTVSPDGLTYTFILRPDATFQDGTKVTADDVVYTISKIQDPEIQSPLAANWNGVTAGRGRPLDRALHAQERLRAFYREPHAGHFAEASLAERERRGIPLQRPQTRARWAPGRSKSARSHARPRASPLPTC